jgi:peptidoglycan L-alanyl-D-glutamate endopeptidase CwlK
MSVNLPQKILNRDNLLNANGVYPDLQRKAFAIISDLRGQGIPVVVIEVMRSKTRQIFLKATGKSKTLKSKHIVGLAVDMAFYINGKISYSPPKEWWELYMHCAESHGMIAGGRWKTFHDYCHIQIGE